MTIRFNKLNREALRKLPPGKSITEHGIIFRKLINGDGLFSLQVMVEGCRIKRSIGKESQGITKEIAIQAAAKIKLDARLGRLQISKKKRSVLKFAQVSNDYLERLVLEDGKDIPKKRARITQHLMPYFNRFVLSELTTSQVEQYKKYRKDESAKAATINRELAVLSHLINKALEWEWIERKPCHIKFLREDNGKTVYLTSDQCRRLLESGKQDRNPQIYLFILIGLETGMRSSEILNIRLEDVYPELAKIFIPKAKAGERHQPITANLAHFLTKHIKGLSQKTGWLFPSLGNCLSTTGHTVSIDDAFRRVVNAAGLNEKDITPHTLRHTATSHLAQAGVDLLTIQAITGHKTRSMIERYSHRNGSHIDEAMQKLEAQYRKGFTPELPLTEKKLNYETAKKPLPIEETAFEKWYPQGNSNPCRLREREVS